MLENEEIIEWYEKETEVIIAVDGEGSCYKDSVLKRRGKKSTRMKKEDFCDRKSFKIYNCLQLSKSEKVFYL